MTQPNSTVSDEMGPEERAYAWLDERCAHWYSEHRNDVSAFDCDQMVDAFMAGHEHALSAAPVGDERRPISWRVDLLNAPRDADIVLWAGGRSWQDCNHHAGGWVSQYPEPANVPEPVTRWRYPDAALSTPTPEQGEEWKGPKLQIGAFTPEEVEQGTTAKQPDPANADMVELLDEYDRLQGVAYKLAGHHIGRGTGKVASHTKQHEHHQKVKAQRERILTALRSQQAGDAELLRGLREFVAGCSCQSDSAAMVASIDAALAKPGESK